MTEPHAPGSWAASATSTCSAPNVPTIPLHEVMELLGRLHDEGRSRRVGLALLSARWIGDEANMAARLAHAARGIESLDYAAYLRSRLSPASRFVTVSSAGVEAHLGELARASSGGTLLVTNFDLALCFLSPGAREELWRNLDENFSKSARAILLCVPQASPLGPGGEVEEAWQKAGRVAVAE